MNEIQHKCPKCQTAMKKMDVAAIKAEYKEDQARYLRSDIQGTSGYGKVTFNATSTTTIDYSYLPVKDEKEELVTGIPYECPNCHYKRSYRS